MKLETTWKSKIAVADFNQVLKMLQWPLMTPFSTLNTPRDDTSSRARMFLWDQVEMTPVKTLRLFLAPILTKLPVTKCLISLFDFISEFVEARFHASMKLSDSTFQFVVFFLVAVLGEDEVSFFILAFFIAADVVVHESFEGL